MLKASAQLHELRDQTQIHTQACTYDSQHMVNSQELVIQTKSNSCMCREYIKQSKAHINTKRYYKKLYVKYL